MSFFDSGVDPGRCSSPWLGLLVIVVVCSSSDELGFEFVVLVVYLGFCMPVVPLTLLLLKAFCAAAVDPFVETAIAIVASSPSTLAA